MTISGRVPLLVNLDTVQINHLRDNRLHICSHPVPERLAGHNTLSKSLKVEVAY
jgi:hypothetical protein